MLRNLLIAIPLAVGLLTLLAAAWLLLGSLPSMSGRVVLGGEAGLARPVDVMRDGRAVPHIRAESVEDAIFALGFVHAQDRLWQMELMRRRGAGRLAEVLGGRALASDRMMRTLGLYRLAERQFERLLPETRSALESYAAGVNAWIGGRSSLRPLPPEFTLTGHRPEPWRPADSLVWGKMMALELGGNWRGEILRARLGKRLSPAQVDQLWPARGTGTAEVSDQALEALALAFPAPARDHFGASNAWVVAAEQSVTGAPILANDPHLGFSAPIMWYLARIEAPGFNLAGATVPGVPFVILGHNGRLAWGMSSAQADIADLFLERVDPADPARYLAPEGSLPFETRSETIRVRGGVDVEMVRRETRHGPVISDLVEGADSLFEDGTVLALSATFLRDGDLTPQAMLAMNQAEDMASFRAALADFHVPVMNVVHAETGGAIAYATVGRVPVRASNDGYLPMPGWTGEADWTGFLPFRELPFSENPATGNIIAANQKMVDDDYPHFLSRDWDDGFRAERIGRMLQESPAHSLDSMARIQRDTVSLMALELLPFIVQAEPELPRDRRALRMLAEWNGEMSRRRPEPLIFVALLDELERAIYGDELGDLFDLMPRPRPRFLLEVLTGNREWCDDVATLVREDCNDRINLATASAMDKLAKRFGENHLRWRWGDVHIANFPHPLTASIPWASGFWRLSVQTDGGFDSINRGAMRSGGFEHVHGSGFRAIYDMDDLGRSRFMIATGQSGNPVSSHYGDLLPEWSDGRFMRLGVGWRDLEQTGIGALTLVP